MSGTRENVTVGTAPEEEAEHGSTESQTPEEGDDTSDVDEEELNKLQEENRILDANYRKWLKKYNEKLDKILPLYPEDSGDESSGSQGEEEEEEDDSSDVEEEEVKKLIEGNQILCEKAIKRIDKHKEKIVKIITLHFDEDSDDECVPRKRRRLNEKKA